MRKGHISSQFNDCRRVFSADKYDIQGQLPPRATKVGLAGLGVSKSKRVQKARAVENNSRRLI
jgi:hypothetical protein